MQVADKLLLHRGVAKQRVELLEVGLVTGSWETFSLGEVNEAHLRPVLLFPVAKQLSDKVERVEPGIGGWSVLGETLLVVFNLGGGLLRLNLHVVAVDATEHASGHTDNRTTDILRGAVGQPNLIVECRLVERVGVKLVVESVSELLIAHVAVAWVLGTDSF